jgi:hypothetical protein
MQSAVEYLAKTESAVRKLFDGVDTYLEVLHSNTVPVFVTSTPPGPQFGAEYDAWTRANASDLEALREAERIFLAESFALDTLCGAIFQVAEKVLECYSENELIPCGLEGVVDARGAKFCIGRPVRTLPLGLVIYAARNQHTHFNDGKLREPSATVFERLAISHGYQSEAPFRDPAFDLRNPSLVSYACNVLTLIGWRTYDLYYRDLTAMLKI